MGKVLSTKDGFLSFSNSKNIVSESKIHKKLYKPLSEFAWRPASDEEIKKERVPSLQLLEA